MTELSTNSSLIYPLYPQKLSFIKIGLLMPFDLNFNDFKFFFDLTYFVSIFAFGQYYNGLFRSII